LQNVAQTFGLFQPIIIQHFATSGLYFMAVVNRYTAKDKISKAWFQYGRNGRKD
jgi:hypothetical protein